MSGKLRNFFRGGLTVTLLTVTAGCDGGSEPSSSRDRWLGTADGGAAPSADGSTSLADGADEEACDGTACSSPSFCPAHEFAPESWFNPTSEKADLTVKFVEGSHVRLRERKLVIEESALLPEDPGLLCCSGLAVCEAQAQLARVNGYLTATAAELFRGFSRDEAELELERATIRQNLGEFVGDYNLWYKLRVDQSVAEDVIALLRGETIVEVAYRDAIVTTAGL